MEISGKVIKVVKNEGLKKDNVTPWVRYDVEINHEQGQFPKNAIISFTGKGFDGVLNLENSDVRIYFDIDSNWYKDNPQTRLKGYKYDKK